MKKDKLYTAGKNIKPNLFLSGGGLLAEAQAYKSANPWDFADDKSLIGQYIQTDAYKQGKGGLFNMTRESNPFSRANAAGTISNVSSVLGDSVVDLASNGYSAGKGFNTALSTMRKLNTGIPLVDAIKNGGSIVVQTLGNLGFGLKENKENIAALHSNNALARSAGNNLVGSTTSDDLIKSSGQMTSSLGFGTKDLVKGGWFAKGKARRKGQGYINQEGSALAYQNHGLTTGAEKVDSNIDDVALVNSSAFGGPIVSPMGLVGSNTGAINYDLMMSSLINKQQQIEQNNSMKNMFAGMPNINARGGKIHIKHPGRLTALKKRTGKTEAELYNDGNPAHKKMVVFARNARKWKKAYGGYLDAMDNLSEAEYNMFDDGGKANDWLRYAALISPSQANLLNGYKPSSTKLAEQEYLTPEIPATKLIVPAPPARIIDDSKILDNKYNNQLTENAYKEALNYNDKLREQMAEFNRSVKQQNNDTLFALGGDIQNHGADWTTGMRHIDEGGSHENNPNQGVQVGVDPEGTPNLVEEGETIFNDYVFSNRIECDDETKEKFHVNKKRSITFAELSKKLEREASERPNDPISQAALKEQLSDLADEQERQKQELEAERTREAFEALTPEEQANLMQYAQQQQAAEQEAAMQEQAMAAQQAAPQEVVSPEEQMMQEQMIAQQGGMPESYAYGGNLFDDGGYKVTLDWVTKKHPEVKDKEAVAKALWKYMQSDRNNHYRPAKVGRNSPYRWYPELAWSNLTPTILTNRNREHYFNKLADLGLSEDQAFEIVYPNKEPDNKYRVEERENARKKFIDNRNKKVSQATAGNNTTSASTRSKSRWKVPSTGEVFNTKEEAEARAREIAAAKKAKVETKPQQNTASAASKVTNNAASTGAPPMQNFFEKDAAYALRLKAIGYSDSDIDNIITNYGKQDGSYVPTNAAANVQAEERRQETKPETAPEVKPEVRKPAAQASAGNQPVRQNGNSGSKPAARKTAAATSPQAVQPSGPFTGGTINVGTWNTNEQGDHWNEYGLPGLEKYVREALVDYNSAAGDPQKQREIAQHIADTINGVQESYWNNVVPTLGQQRQTWSQGVGNHQELYNNVTGNAGFVGVDDNGNLYDRIGMALNKPQGHNTTDTIGKWKDYFSGPQTWLRHLGESGNNLDNMVAALRDIGIDYSPYKDWTIGEGDDARQLYRASLSDPAAQAPEAPVAPAPATEASATPGEIIHHAIEGDEDFLDDFNIDPSTLGAETRRVSHINDNGVLETTIYHASPDGYNGVDAYTKGQPYSGAAKTDTDDYDVVPIHRNEKLRYAGLLGPAVGLGMQLAGIGRPKTGDIDAVLDAYDKNGSALADYRPIGNYLRYTPMDIWAEQNRLNANARATDRYIANNASPIGTKIAGWLANNYNNQIGSGQLYRQALEYNDNLNKQVQDFNRGTDMFNAQAYNQTSQTNAQIRNHDRALRAQLGMQAALQKADMDAAWYNGIYGNVSGLFKGIGDLGRENAQHNMIADMAATGIFGTIKNQPIANDYIRVVPKNNQTSKGGKIYKKKGKRGLTY